MERYVHAVCRELELRRDEVGEKLQTIYLGGGTPSLLGADRLKRILSCIGVLFAVDAHAEVTVEMNPDDVVEPLLELFKQDGSVVGVNRVSLGVQTFDDELLRLLRRRHDAQRAIHAVQALQQAGIGNISIDLIYGLPGQTMAGWERDLQTAFSLGVQHLSSYALSYEPGTPLTRWRAQGKVIEVSEDTQVHMYERLCSCAQEAGFLHYEISNFALPGYHSRHNSSYWTGEPYLGVGPGAHSYDGRHTRRANRPDLTRYLDVMMQGNPAMDGLFMLEHLTESERYDEAVMCGLRTAQGVALQRIRQKFGAERESYLLRMAAPHLRAGRLVITEDCLHLTSQALMVSDDVMSDLMS